MQCLNIGILWQLLKTTHLSYDSKASLNSNTKSLSWKQKKKWQIAERWVLANKMNIMFFYSTQHMVKINHFPKLIL